MGQKVLQIASVVCLFSFSWTPANQSIHPNPSGRIRVHPSLAFEWVNYTPTRENVNIAQWFSV